MPLTIENSPMLNMALIASETPPDGQRSAYSLQRLEGQEGS